MTQELNITNLPCTAAEFGDLAADLLKMGKQVRFRAMGSSMHPLVRDGDTLLIAPCQSFSIRPGDILLCTGGNHCLVVHRVIRRKDSRNNRQFLTQGDQAPWPDGWIDASRIYGRLEEIERDGKRFNTTGPFRLLGLLIVMARRLGLRHSKAAALLSAWLKKLPAFSGYLDQEKY